MSTLSTAYKYSALVLGLLLLGSCAQIHSLGELEHRETPVSGPKSQLAAKAKAQVNQVNHNNNNEEERVEISDQAAANEEDEVEANLELSDQNPFVEASAKVANSAAVKDFCKKIDGSYHRWGWGKSKCETYSWHHVRNSVKGDPLMWVVFGDEGAHRKMPKDTTLILCGQHGDEITPIKFCFDTIHHMRKLKASDSKEARELKDKLVVIVPIVNPDSYFKKFPTRTNDRGVDVNRNFPTRDWNQEALAQWKRRYGGDKRRYPGPSAISEPETLFQVNLIKRYQPNKIVSVHAPLTLLDYDGPDEFGAGTTGGKVGVRANQLLIQMSREARGYRIKNYPYFPGSLGNYAGNERNIPTYTLELPSSDNRRHREFWRHFSGAITEAILHDMRDDVDVAGRPDLSEESATN